MKRGLTATELLVIIAIIGVLIALLIPAIQAARNQANKNKEKNAQLEAITAKQNLKLGNGQKTTRVKDTEFETWLQEKGSNIEIVCVVPYIIKSQYTSEIIDHLEYTVVYRELKASNFNE